MPATDHEKECAAKVRQGDYEIGVWAGSASTPTKYESYAITSFDLAVLTCTSTDLSGPAQPPSAGSSIAFPASAVLPPA